MCTCMVKAVPAVVVLGMCDKHSQGNVDTYHHRP